MTDVNTGDQTPEITETVLTKEQVLADVAARYKDLEPEALLEKVAEDLAKKEEIIGFKNRALMAEKAKNKPASEVTQNQEAPKAFTKEEILNEALQLLRQESSSKEVESTIKSVAADEEEQKAIREAYQNDIVKTGDVEKDLKKAIAIARANQIDAMRQTKTQAEIDEAVMLKFSGGAVAGRSNDSAPKLSLKQQNAANTLRSLGHTEEQIAKAISGIK